MKALDFVEIAAEFTPPLGLVERCIDNEIVLDKNEFSEYFVELLKFLWLGRYGGLDDSVPMYNKRIDNIWHEWILFTKAYGPDCMQLYGRFMHHVPVSPKQVEDPSPKTRFLNFINAYEKHFGALPAIWGLDPKVETVPRRECLDPVEQCDTPFTNKAGGVDPVELCDSSASIVVSGTKVR